MTEPDDDEHADVDFPAPEPAPRQRYLVGVTKAPPGERDLFARLFPTSEALAAAGWVDAHGAMDDDTGVAVGQPAAYSVELTSGQLRIIAEADVDNLRWLQLEPPPLRKPAPVPTGAAGLPPSLPEDPDAVAPGDVA